MRFAEIMPTMRSELESNKLRHVQVLMTTYGGQKAIKFTDLDDDSYKTRLKAITDRYEITLVKETKTTQTYTI